MHLSDDESIALWSVSCNSLMTNRFDVADVVEDLVVSLLSVDSLSLISDNELDADDVDVLADIVFDDVWLPSWLMESSVLLLFTSSLLMLWLFLL